MKKLVLLIVLSLAISTIIFFLNSSNLIVSGWQDKLAEIGVMAIPVFIILALLYYSNRALVKRIKNIRKRPSK